VKLNKPYGKIEFVNFWSNRETWSSDIFAKFCILVNLPWFL